ncbi:MAG: universal stress protein [Gammaproteobacteria bacterium]
MKKYNHILLATSLSEDSQKVADKAKMIAERAGAKLSIVHVIGYSPMLYGAGEFAFPVNSEIETSLMEQAKEGLANEAERIGVAPNDQWIETGDTTEGLAALVNKIKADLLIVGSHEHHGLGYMLGSTSNAMLHVMPCDILAVRITSK